jgi:hypothetical protein
MYSPITSITYVSIVPLLDSEAFEIEGGIEMNLAMHAIAIIMSIKKIEC